MKYIPSFIKVDFLRKAIALIFALLVWWKISIQIGSEEIVRNVPVKIIDNQVNVSAGDPSEYFVNFTVKTLSQKRGLLSASDIKVNIQLPTKALDGERLLEYDILRDAEITKPLGVKLLSCDPDKIFVKADLYASRQLPIMARFTGTLLDDFACGEVSISPAKVTVYGPESALKNLKQINTEYVVLDAGIKENFEKVCRLEAIGNAFTFSPDKVIIHVEIYKKNQKKTFKGLPISMMTSYGMPAGVVKLLPTNVDVVISGPVSIVENIDGSQIIPFVKLEKGEQREKNYKVDCYLLNPEIEIISITPASVKVATSGEK